MSVVRDVNRRTPAPVGGGPRGRRRAVLAALAAASLLWGTAACGVQTTGVHISAAGPVTLDSATPTASASVAGSGQFTYYVFLWHGETTGNVSAVMRSADHEMSWPEIVDSLASTTDDEVSQGFTTQVPYQLGEALLPTKQKHAYQVVEGVPEITISPATLTQVVCTLDLYWVLHPDPDPAIKASTWIAGGGITYPGWDDCSQQPGFNQALQELNVGVEAKEAGPVVRNPQDTDPSYQVYPSDPAAATRGTPGVGPSSAARTPSAPATPSGLATSKR